MTSRLLFRKGITPDMMRFIDENWKRSFAKTGMIRPRWDLETFKWRSACQETPLFAVEYVDGRIVSLVCILSKKIVHRGAEKVLVNVCWATSSTQERSLGMFLQFCASAVEQLPFAWDSIVFSALVGRTDRYWRSFSQRLGKPVCSCGEYAIFIKQLGKFVRGHDAERLMSDAGWFSVSEVRTPRDADVAWSAYSRKKSDTAFLIDDRFLYSELCHSGVSKTFVARYGESVVGAITITKETFFLEDDARLAFNIRFVDADRMEHGHKVWFHECVFDYCRSEGADLVRISSCVSNPFFYVTSLDFIDSNQRNAIIAIGDDNPGTITEYTSGAFDLI